MKELDVLQDISIIALPMRLGMGKVNCYLIRTHAGYLLIDMGATNARTELFGALEDAGCKPGNLLLVAITHGDFDHTGNAAALRSVFMARIAMYRDDAGMAEQGNMFVNRKKPNSLIGALVPLFTGFEETERFTPDLLLDETCDLRPYGLEARVLSLPGHSKGSIGILTASGDLFCGDLFKNLKPPRLNSLMDDPTAAQATLEALAKLPVIKVYPGHGKPFAMERLAQ